MASPIVISEVLKYKLPLNLVEVLLFCDPNGLRAHCVKIPSGFTYPDLAALLRFLFYDLSNTHVGVNRTGTSSSAMGILNLIAAVLRGIIRKMPAPIRLILSYVAFWPSALYHRIYCYFYPGKRCCIC